MAPVGYGIQPLIIGGSILGNYSVFYFAVVTGWETENKYRVRNTLGQQVYFAAERKNCLCACS